MPSSEFKRSHHLFEESRLDDLLFPLDSDFNIDAHWGGQYKDRTDYLLSLAKYGCVFLQKPFCMDKSSTFSTLLSMSQAAYLEKIIPNYVLPSSLSQTVFAQASSEQKESIAAPFAVYCDFQEFSLDGLLKLNESYTGLINGYEQRKETLLQEQEQLKQSLDEQLAKVDQAVQGQLKKLDIERKDKLIQLDAEHQAKRNKLNSYHEAELKELEQEHEEKLAELARAFKADLKDLEQALPTKLDELDQAYTLEIKDLDNKMQLKSSHLEQRQQSELDALKRAHQAEYKDTAEHTIEFSSAGAKKLAKLREGQSQELFDVDAQHTKQFAHLRELHARQREELKASYAQRSADFRLAHSQRQSEVRSLYRLQQADLRLAYVQKQEELKAMQNQRYVKLDEMYAGHKEVLNAEYAQKGDALRASFMSKHGDGQYEKDSKRIQSQLLDLEEQHKKALTSFYSSLSQKLYGLKEDTINLIKQVHDFNVDWQGFWDEDILSFSHFVSRCLNICFAGVLVKGFMSALRNHSVAMQQLNQPQLAAESQVILDSLVRLIPIFLSGSLNSLKDTVLSIFQLMPTHSIVLYLNEFDALFIRYFSSPLLAEQVEIYMQGFCEVVNEAAKHIRFALMTGLTQYSKTAEELGFNKFVNLTDEFAFA